MVVYRLQKGFRNIRFESKWNMTFFWLFQRKMSGSNGTSEKVVLFFRTEYSKPKFAFYFSKPSLIPVRPSRSFSGKWNWFAQMVNEIPGRSKFTSPEFCVPFAFAVDWPACPCKWQTTDVNAFLPRGHHYYLRKKMYFFEFFFLQYFAWIPSV